MSTKLFSLLVLEHRVRRLPKRRIWAYPPQWYWYGWHTLFPIDRGHDDFSRETLTIGWTITGRIVIPLHYCGEAECYEQTLRWSEDK